MSHYPSILYVEDDPLSRMVVEILLREEMGLSNVMILADSTDFETRLEELPWIPDIILLDIHMKPLTGFQMLEILRKHPVYCNKPIVALTASVMNEEVELLRGSGFNGLVAKPLNEQTFPQVLQQFLEGESVWTI